MVPAAATQRGMTLIELIVFTVIMGIAAVALLSMYRAVLPHGTTPSQITIATQLAQERMELLLGQRDAGGYSTAVLTDPCAGGTPPAICNEFLAAPVPGAASYSVVAVGISPVVTWSGLSADNYRMFGVTVLGPDGGQLASLSAVIANY